MGWVPVLAAAVVEIGAMTMVAEGLLGFGTIWPWLAVILFYVPFDVRWTRLALNGMSGRQTHSYFRLTRRDGRYLLASVLVILPWLTMLLPVWLTTLGARNFDHHLKLEAGSLGVLLLVGIVICLVRSIFVFPAIATDNFRSLAQEWERSKGTLEILLALLVLARLPYLVGLDILDRLIHRYSPFLLSALLTLSQSVVYLLAEATSVACIAFAYRRILELPPSERSANLEVVQAKGNEAAKNAV